MSSFRPLFPWSISVVLAAVAPIIGCTGEPRPQIAHSQAALIVARGPACTVSLTKLSYDDPSSDDAEFIELEVVRVTGQNPHENGSGGGMQDACGPPEPAPEASPGDLVLGDCGLDRIELVNGDASDCAPYRTLSLSGVVVPDDGFIVICSASSTLAACDVATAGTTSLPNSWLQNGPSDGLRFVSTEGGAVELAYENEAGPCFSTTPTALADESGESADGSDDVNVACDDSFVSLPEAEARLREPNRCPIAPNDAPPPSAADGAASTPVTPGPFTGSGSAFGTAEQDLDRDAATFVFDAGDLRLPDAGSSPRRPSPPSCTASSARGVSSCASAAAVGLLLLGVGFMRRAARDCA